MAEDDLLQLSAEIGTRLLNQNKELKKGTENLSFQLLSKKAEIEHF